MNKTLQAEFQEKWGKYFGTARLPVCWFYSDTPDKSDLEKSKNVNRCLIGNLDQVFDGQTFVYHKSSPGCLGGKRYTGYSQKLRSGFRYFLSCGIEGQTEGERYNKSLFRHRQITSSLKDGTKYRKMKIRKWWFSSIHRMS